MLWQPITQNITIEKAREILGKKADCLKDKELQCIIRALYALSESAVKSVENNGER